MIYTGGHKYRTMLQPIYVGNRRIRRVYVGDRQVYPDRLYAKEPVMLRVTIKPNKLTYQVGDEIDYTGAVFDLLYRDNTICKRLTKDQVNLVPLEESTVAQSSADKGKITVIVTYYWDPDAEDDAATLVTDYAEQVEEHETRGRRY